MGGASVVVLFLDSARPADGRYICAETMSEEAETTDESTVTTTPIVLFDFDFGDDASVPLTLPPGIGAGLSLCLERATPDVAVLRCRGERTDARVQVHDDTNRVTIQGLMLAAVAEEAVLFLLAWTADYSVHVDTHLVLQTANRRHWFVRQVG